MKNETSAGAVCRGARPLDRRAGDGPGRQVATLEGSRIVTSIGAAGWSGGSGLIRAGGTGKPRFCGELLKRRVRALERGAWFLSTTHDDEALEETIAAARDAAQAV